MSKSIPKCLKYRRNFIKIHRQNCIKCFQKYQKLFENVSKNILKMSTLFLKKCSKMFRNSSNLCSVWASTTRAQHPTRLCDLEKLLALLLSSTCACIEISISKFSFTLCCLPPGNYSYVQSSISFLHAKAIILCLHVICAMHLNVRVWKAYVLCLMRACYFSWSWNVLLHQKSRSKSKLSFANMKLLSLFMLFIQFYEFNLICQKSKIMKNIKIFKYSCQ